MHPLCSQLLCQPNSSVKQQDLSCILCCSSSECIKALHQSQHSYIIFMHIQIYSYLCIFGRGSYLKNTQSLNKYVIWVNFLGKPVMGFSVLVAQT